MTSRVSLGTSVVILPYRNPVILAKMIATADVLSRGRIILGAGVGWLEGEFDVLNAPFANRGPLSDEYLRLLKELWTNPTPSFQGEHFQFSDVTSSPMPVQKPHPPLWIGGWTRRAARRAVEFGDYWHASLLDPKELAKFVSYMRRHSESVGREDPPRVSFRGTVNFTGDAIAGQRPPLSGSTEDVIADLREYSEAGVDYAVLGISGDSYADIFRSMERFITEVKPRVAA